MCVRFSEELLMEVILHKEAKKFANKKKLDKIIVSMSHTNNYAVSNVILASEDKKR